MKSPDTFVLLDTLAAKQDEYLPNETVQQTIRDKTVVMLVGPSCAGKSLARDRIVAMDPKNFGIVNSFTSRAPRRDDTEETRSYVPHTNEGIADVHDRIQRGEVVQYAVHPTTSRLYGTLPTGYPAKYNLLDTVWNAAASIRQLPFEATPFVGIVSEPDPWMEWFSKRFSNDSPERPSRLLEAAQSLSWLLSQPDTIWAVNEPADRTAAARTIIDITLGQSGGDERGPELANACLQVLDI